VLALAPVNRSLKLASLGASLSALGVSTAIHAAILLAPVGHRDPSGGTVFDAEGVDILTDPAPPRDTPEAEPAVLQPGSPAARRPAHTHPYRVARSRDWTPNDPSIEHAPASPPATAVAPAPSAPLGATIDDAPRFTMAIGAAAGDACGVVSASGSAPARESEDAPVAEESVDAPARLVRGPAPAYPDAARADGVEGDVRLELVVDTSGAVESARVLRGAGRGLDDAALRAARQFRFAPATRQGRAVRVRVGWSMQFRLR